MRSLHLPLLHHKVVVRETADALAETDARARKGLRLVAAGLLAEAILLAPVAVLVVLVLVAQALL